MNKILLRILLINLIYNIVLIIIPCLWVLVADLYWAAIDYNILFEMAKSSIFGVFIIILLIFIFVFSLLNICLTLDIRFKIKNNNLNFLKIKKETLFLGCVSLLMLQLGIIPSILNILSYKKIERNEKKYGSN